MLPVDELIGKAAAITCHSDQVQPGSIFVAIRGRAADGNNFAPAAASKGALAVVSDCPQCLPQLPVPVIGVTDARLALAQLASAFYGHPSRKLKLTGITGSNGKTTIACMLEHIFVQAGLRTGLIGTIRVNTGKGSCPSRLTTPDAVSLQQYLAQMLSNKVTHAAMEVSAQGIDMQRVAQVTFAAGILTNVCADHLDFHGGFAGYLAAKAKFLDLLAPSTPLIVNVADPYCQAIAKPFSGNIISAAVDNPADIIANISHLSTYGSAFTLTLTRPLPVSGHRLLAAGDYAVTLGLPGRHNVENALLAAAAALLQGVAPATIIQALRSFRGVERRMNILHASGLTIVDDTALNPGSIDAVFAAIASFRYSRLIIVNAIRGQRGAAINTANATTIALWRQKLAFELIVTASTDQVTPADTVTGQEQQAFLSALAAHRLDHTYRATLAGAVTAALEQSLPGDLIVLLGAQGMDNGRQLLSALLKPSASRPCGYDRQSLPAWAGK